MAAITVSDDALGRAVSLISAFCGNPLGAPAKGASTSAKTSEGTVTGLAACATALAAKSPAAADLLGRTPLEQAQVRTASAPALRCFCVVEQLRQPDRSSSHSHMCMPAPAGL
jgi:hypothetical protein